MALLSISGLDPSSEVPLYRQIFDQLRVLIDSGRLEAGTKLPPTRELAGHLGLNRATISAAYELLEADGLITGQVGRGSFVAGAAGSRTERGDLISFARSRPSELLFPIEEFRAACGEVIRSSEVQDVLQLGSPSGYGPLRRYLLQRSRDEGIAGDGDDVLITSGVQQVFDLLQRNFVANGETILIEDPVYPGLKIAFERAGARVIGMPITRSGLDVERAERIASAERPALIVVTPNFQNPTGNTLSLDAREGLLRIANRTGALLVENDIYGELRYEGESVPLIKQLDSGHNTVLLRSFSKLAFPGLRVGWVVGPRVLVERLTSTKQWSDLHTDQLSQAVLLRFAESGRLAQHRSRVLRTGGERLHAALSACERYLPEGSEWTRPQGGMNLWVRLRETLDAGELLPGAEREGVTYLPGRHFAVGAPQPNCLRISFAAVSPERIEAGIGILGRVFRKGLDRAHEQLECAVIV